MKQIRPILIFLVLVLEGCTPDINLTRQETCMGTFAKITCIDNNRELCRTSVDKAFCEIKRIEDRLSKFRESSDIFRINQSGTEPTEVNEETFEILKKAKLFYQASGGAFDISVSPLLELWGFYNREKNKPEISADFIKEKLSLIGLDKVVLNERNHTVYLEKPGMALDLGGIAKGYAVDKAKEVMINLGVKNALINIGGEVYCLGKGKKKEGWSVGIQHPRRPDKIIAVINLKDKAVSTSGAYENFIEFNGKKFGHIIDPKTGYPIDSDLVSVTVVADDCLTTDALATTVFVLGKEKSLELLKSLEAEAVFISKTNNRLEISVTENLKRNLKETGN